MSQPNRTEAGNLPAVHRFLPLLLLLFAGSGCSALIYEIVWFQLLQLAIGSTAVSLGVLLGTFMGGMCLGSLALPRIISGRFHPLRVYGLLELGLGIIGIAVLFGMPDIHRLYTEAAGSGRGAFLLRGAVCAACLLPPTMLMGATLPAIARWVETTPQGVSWLGLFYGGNIAGAVFGCLLAGFYLLRMHDMATATYVAAALNGAVALLSLILALVTPHAPRTVSPTLKGAVPLRGLWSVYVTIALSGACALAAEVIWTRLLSLMLGATVYTFSIILAVFLLGLGLGSSIGSFMARTSSRPRLLLGCCQLLLAAAIAWTAYMLTQSLPYWPINPYLSRSPWFTFQLDLLRCLWAILPATFLWGASFPLALAAGASPGQDPGRLVGGVYAANTIGAIVGALGSSLFLIHWLGTQEAQRILIGLSALAALIIIAPTFFQPIREAASSAGRLVEVMPRILGALLLVAALFVAGFLAWRVPSVPWELVAFGRAMSTYGYGEGWQKLYMGEGMNSSIAVTQLATGVRNFHVSGKIEASSEPQDMRLQRMLGHLPALLHSRPRSVLVVGFGAGVTAGSFVVYPEIERIVICEIEPLIPQEVASHFAKENYDVVHDPRVEIVHDDARHYILTTPEKFDIITSDPIHPWVKGSATLYTQEYFELCKRHLNPGGLITQWVPLYESDLDVVKSEIATFFEAFPDGTIWSNDQHGHGYDIVLLGQTEALTIDADKLHERLEQLDHQAIEKALPLLGVSTLALLGDPRGQGPFCVAAAAQALNRTVEESLGDVEFQTVVGLLATYGGRASDLRSWLQDAQINRDRNLRLQYLAGMELNTNQGKLIHDVMMTYRQFPESIFNGSGQRSRWLKLLLERAISAHQKGLGDEQPEALR